MNRLLSVSILAGITALTGCSVVEKNPIYGEHGIFRDRNQEYEKATVGKKLVIPESIQAKPTQDRLVIPAARQTAFVRQGEFEVPRPEFFYADTGSDTVSLKKFGDQKVVVVDEPIAAVWEKTLDFLKFNNIKIASVNPQKAIIESDWITQQGPEYSFTDRWIKRLTFQDVKGATQNKLQVRLKPDPENYNRTSIALKLAQFAEGEQVPTVDWAKDSRELPYQTDMMYELLRYMSKASLQPSKRSLLALQSKQAPRPLLGRDSRGNPVLKISERTDKAWASLNEAVDSAQFDVGTRNQSTGMMYMTYTTSTPIEDSKKQGFFEWLFSDREEIKIDTGLVSSVFGDKKEDGIRYSAKDADAIEYAEGEVQPLSDPNNKANQEGYKIWFAGRVIYVFGGGEKGRYNADTDSYEHVGQYQLKMNPIRSGIYLSVLNDQGLAAPAVIAEEILWTIKDNMPN